MAAPQDNHAGDGENDVEFVRDAGLGVAMKNGRDAVKQVAKRVTARTNARRTIHLRIERHVCGKRPDLIFDQTGCPL